MTAMQVIWLGLACFNVVSGLQLAATLGRFAAHCTVFGWSTTKRLILIGGGLVSVGAVGFAGFCAAMAAR